MTIESLNWRDWRYSVVHVLVDNKPLCRFTDAPIRYWPAGHVWVDRTKSEITTCVECQKRRLALEKRVW